MDGRTTPSQTVGPFFSIGFSWLERADLTAEATTGERVTISGCVTEGAGQPVPDAVLEIWQADESGRYADPDADAERGSSRASRFGGFGRIPVDAEGRFRFTTIKPGASAGPDGRKQAPHLTVSIFMRGLLRRLVTRVYFPSEPANESDPVLALVPASRRHTLIAQRDDARGGALIWNVHLQGDLETVFFDC